MARGDFKWLAGWQDVADAVDTLANVAADAAAGGLYGEGEDDDDYTEPEEFIEQAQELIEEFLNLKLGRSVGLNADWSSEAWHMGPGQPNRTSGDFYIVDTEDGNGPEMEFVIVQRWYDDDAGDRIDEVWGPGRFRPAMKWLENRSRQWNWV